MVKPVVYVMDVLQNKNRVEVNDVSAYWNCREGQELYSHYSETAALVRPTCSVWSVDLPTLFLFLRRRCRGIPTRKQWAMIIVRGST